MSEEKSRYITDDQLKAADKMLKVMDGEDYQTIAVAALQVLAMAVWELAKHDKDKAIAGVEAGARDLAKSFREWEQDKDAPSCLQ